MLLPATYRADSLARYTPEQLETCVHCICGKPVQLKNAYVTWTHPADKEEWAFFAICDPICILMKIAEGNC